MNYKNRIYIATIQTALGPMLMGSTEEGITALEFLDQENYQAQLQSLKKALSAELLESENPPYVQELKAQLTEYFSGRRRQFDLPLVMLGTEFQQKVWKILLEVPYGQTRSYKQQAERFGNLKAIRAVASANGKNPISIIVPCHRIVGSDGSLTGYAGGILRKQQLLTLEQRYGN